MHCANCGDHYAYFDRMITPINYLAYSEHEWASGTIACCTRTGSGRLTSFGLPSKRVLRSS